MKLYKILFLFTLLSIQGSVLIFSQSLKQNPDLIKGQLENGLTYYIYPNQTPKGEAVYRLFIKSGSVYEEESQKGLAHFLEHMAFNGTKHFPGNSMVRFLESKGAKFGQDLNAHTSYNETVYKLQLPSSDKLVVDSTMTILADWAGGLLLDGSEIEKERGVIMSEWLSKTGPKYDAQDVLLNELLNNSRYASRKVIGDTAVIKNFHHAEIRNYYNKWYDPSLMAVAVAGDIDPEQIKKAIVNKFGSLVSPLKGQDLPTYSIDEYNSAEAKIVMHESLDKVELLAMQLLPYPNGVNSEQSYLPYLERTILNRLFQARIQDLAFNNPPYKKASIGLSTFLNTTSVLLASVELTPSRINEGIEAFASEAEQMYRYGFIPLEIEKVKKNYLAALKRKAESESSTPSISLMGEMYSDFYSGNMIITPQEEYRIAEKYLAQIDSVSLINYMHKTVRWSKSHFILSAFNSVSQEIPSTKRLLDIFSNLPKRKITPYSKEIAIPDQLLAQEPKRGKIVSQSHLKEIDAYRLELSNGTQVIFKSSDTDKGNILLTGFRKGGLYSLDSAQYINGLFARNIISLSGAGLFSREALSHFLAGKKASVRLLIDRTRIGIAGSAASNDMGSLFELLYLKWNYPRIDNDIYNQVKEKTIEERRTLNETESDKFSRDVSYILQGHNYTNRQLNDTIIENELNREQLLPVFDKLFGKASEFTFVIVGDCTLKEVKPYIEKYIGSLPSGKAITEYKFERGAQLLGDTTLIRHTGESPRAIVNLTFQQHEVQSSMQYENLQNEFLKSVIRMKLLKSLREELGMVYSVGVSANSAIYPSPLSRQTIAFTTAPENVDTLIARTHTELREMVNNPSSFESELADVKANLIKKMQLDIQKNEFWSSYIRNTIFNNEKDWKYINDFNKVIADITTKDIAEAIQQKFFNSPSTVKAILYPMKNDEQKK